MIKKTKKERCIKAVFWTLMAIFVMLIICFLFPDKRAVFLVMAVLAFAFLALGIILIILTVKLKVKGRLKIYLILTGASSAGFLVGSVLHNFFYALAVVSENIPVLHYLMEFLHVAFFLISIPICPIVFLVGAIGAMVVFVKGRR